MTDHRDPRRRPMLALVVVSTLLWASACSSSDEGSDAGPTSAADAGATTTTEEAAESEPLRILVTNDDGVDAPGIDALVNGLVTLDDVLVEVIAPADQRSATGASETDGPVLTSMTTLASGHPATAVDGFPVDAVKVALDGMTMEFHLVVSGINSTQNLGPMVDISGTVGAARAGAARGVPALAVSSGVADPVDYEAAIPFVLDWVTERRSALLDGTAPAVVDNLNVPSCPVGEVRGVVEVAPDTNTGGQLVQHQDCTSTVEDPASDSEALNNGFAALTPDLRGPL